MKTFYGFVCLNLDFNGDCAYNLVLLKGFFKVSSLELIHLYILVGNWGLRFWILKFIFKEVVFNYSA
jgi:hypothetical protein